MKKWYNVEFARNTMRRYYIRPGSIACHVLFIWGLLRAWLLPIWATVAIMILCSINI